jgi:hypothetical protein
MVVLYKPTLIVETLLTQYKSLENSDLVKLTILHFPEIEFEDMVCFMANVYTNKPHICNTILWDLLPLYRSIDWSLIKVHFKVAKNDILNTKKRRNKWLM